MKSASTTTVLILVAGTAATVLAGPNPRLARSAAFVPAAGRDVPVILSNNISGDGFLRVDPDDYGAVTVWTFPDNYDYYDPAGPLATGNPTFASSVFLFFGTTDRCVLALDGRDLRNFYPSGLLVLTLTQPSVTSDFDGDGVHDTADSAFTVTGGSVGANLAFQLRQRVYKPPTGSAVARFEQRYTITNNGSSPISFKFLAHLDMDLMWNGNYQDVAGTVALGGTINPYNREPGTSPTTDPTAVGLVTTTPGYVYYAGRSGFDPDGPGPDPAMAYGTDLQIWNAYGLPPSWQNYTAGIGYAPSVGELNAAQPPGSATPYDAFMGVQWNITLNPGAQTTVQFSKVYGAITHVPTAPCYPNCDGSTAVPFLNVADFTCFLQRFAAGDLYANCDGSTTPPVLNVADFTCFLQAFAAGCSAP